MESPARLASLFSISGEAVRNGHLARIVTANFFHVNQGHLVSNIVGLLFFSSLLEVVIGRSRVMIVILLSAIAGTLGSLLFHIVDWMVGSSTVLFGVFGGLGVLILKYRRELHQHFITAVISWSISLIMLTTLGYISLERVDQGAHVGGIVAGILSTWVIVRPYSLSELSKPITGGEWVLLIVLLAGFILSFVKEAAMLLPLTAK